MPSLTFGDVRVETSNLDKVLYPQTGTTKGQVIDYYVEIAPAMIPHLAGRPVTRKRWPNGVTSTPFFEKNLAAHAPDWIERKTMHHRSRTVVYPVIDTVAGLAWLGQQASLEVHVPQWRFVRTAENTVGTEGADEMGPATRLVFDLDPGDDVSLADCAEVAIAVRDMVAQIDLVAFPITSGSKGIHVYVPLDRTLGPGGASTVAKQVAGNLETLYPNLVTSTMAKVARTGKVFLDWSQNNPAKTTIAPYSMRGRAEPTVAAPRTWAELERPDGLRQLRFEEVLERYRATGDMLADLDPTDDKLARYRSMRNPRKTPEPVPALPPRRSEGNAFVIHEHHARRLHWDVRLERDGVLASWAVPKGVPETTTENRLAVHTEDHPIEYLTFAATIPKGRVRRRHHDHLGHRHLRDREVARRRGDHPPARRQGGGQIRADPDRRQELADAPDEGSNRSGSTRATSTAADPDFPRGLSPMLATPATCPASTPNTGASRASGTATG